MDAFKDLLKKYFNQTLRYHLKYPEVYTFDFDFYNDRIIMHPNQQAKLIDIIKSTPDIKNQLIALVTRNLKTVISSVHDVSFNTNGIDLIIKFNPGRNIIKELPMETYAEIASKLNLEDLYDFCGTNPQITRICRDQKFWSLLIREKFPQYYVESAKGYNWERVYKGLFYYMELIPDLQMHKLRLKEQSKKRKILHIELSSSEFAIHWERLYKSHPETVKYLILNNLVDIDDITSTSILLNLPDPDIFKYILERHSLTQDTYNYLIEYFFRNFDIMSILTSGVAKDKGTSLTYDKTKLKKMLINNFNQGSLSMLEHFIFYYDLLDLYNDYKFLIDFLDKNLYLYSGNKELIIFVISKLPDQVPINKLLEYITENIQRGKYQLVEILWNKYNQLLSPEDVDYLKGQVELNTQLHSNVKRELHRIIR